MANKRLFSQKYIQNCIFFYGKTNVGYDECKKVCREANLEDSTDTKIRKGAPQYF
jgi:hypothetical protein